MAKARWFVGAGIVLVVAAGCGSRTREGAAGPTAAEAANPAQCGGTPTNPTSTIVTDRPWCATTTATGRAADAPASASSTVAPSVGAAVPVRVVVTEEHVQLGDHLLPPAGRTPTFTVDHVLDRLQAITGAGGGPTDRHHLTARVGVYRLDGNPLMTDLLVYVIEGATRPCVQSGPPPIPGQPTPTRPVAMTCDVTFIVNADTAQSLLVIEQGTTPEQSPVDSAAGHVVGVTVPIPAGPMPDLGDFGTSDALIAALVASGPLTNTSADALAAGTAPPHSICIDIVEGREPSVGMLVHEAIASVRGDSGVLLVFQRADSTRHARLYSTRTADSSGGCRLMTAAPLP